MPAVEREQGDEVEHADEEVEAGDQHEQRDGLVARADLVVRGDLAGETAPSVALGEDEAGMTADVANPPGRIARMVLARLDLP